MGLVSEKRHFLKINRLVKLHQGFLFVIRMDLARKIREIHYVIKPRAKISIGCTAQLCIELNRQKYNYYVNHFVETHNHPLVMQKCAHILPSQRKILATQTIEVDLAEEFSIALKSAHDLIGMQVGGRESLGCTKLDEKNYLRLKRQNNMAYGEARCLLKYFSD